MAVKTYRFGAGQDGNFGALFETDQTAASRSDGWTVGTTAVGRSCEFDAGTKQAAGSFTVESSSPKPASFLTGTTANAFKTPAALTGTFANSDFVFTIMIRSGAGTIQRGRFRLRVFKSVNASGAGATELTGSTVIGVTLSSISTSADNSANVTWSPGGPLTLNNEFLFFVFAWEITTIGQNGSADILIRTGQSAAGSRLVTPDFVKTPLYGVVARPITFNAVTQGRRKTFGKIDRPITFDSVITGKSNNLITNGYFEQNVSGWYVSEGGPTFSRSTVDKHEGVASMLVTTFNQYDSVTTNIDCVAETVYTISMWVKRNEITQNGWRLEVGGALNPIAVSIPQIEGWQYVELSARARYSGAASIQVRNVTWPALSDGTGFVYVDEVRASVKPTARGSIDFPITFGKQVRGRTGKNYHDEVLADGPWLYWRMDEPGAPLDYSGNGIHINGGAGGPQVPGLIPFEPQSMAKGFDGSMMNFGSPLFYQNTFTFEVWLQRTRTDTYEVIVDQYNSGWTLAIFPSGQVGARRSYGPDIAYTDRIRILDTNPHHLTITANWLTQEFIFYLDDQVPESIIGSPWDNGSPANYPFFIGNQWGAYPFVGTMDEMAFYDYVLSPNQIAYHQTIGLRQPPKTLLGVTSLNVSFNKDVKGQRKTFAKTNAPFIFTKDVSAKRTTFGKVDRPTVFGISTSGIRVPFKYYGQVALPIVFNKDVKGQRKAFGQVALPMTFLKDVRGQRTTFGKLDLQIVGGQYVRGIIHAYSRSSMQTLFGKETAGQRKTFGQVALPLTFSKDIRGLRKTFGQVALPIVFDKSILAQRKTFGQITSPFIFDSAIQGTRTAFGKLYLPMNLLFAIGEGHLEVHGKISLPVVMVLDTSGKAIHVGVTLNNAEMIYLGSTPVLAVYVEDQKVWPMT